MKLLGEEFESERNTKTSKLKPKIIGIIWRGPDNNFPPNGEYRFILNRLTAVSCKKESKKAFYIYIYIFCISVPAKIVDFLTAREAWVRQIPVIVSIKIVSSHIYNELLLE